MFLSQHGKNKCIISILTAWNDEWTPLVSVYMLVIHVMCQSLLSKSQRHLCDNGSWNPPMAAMLPFKEQRWALQPIEQKKSRVAPPLWRCKTHNGAAAQCWGTSFPLSLCHPLQGVGEHEETAIPEEYREVMWESSALLLGQALAERPSVLVV